MRIHEQVQLRTRRITRHTPKPETPTNSFMALLQSIGHSIYVAFKSCLLWHSYSNLSSFIDKNSGAAISRYNYDGCTIEHANKQSINVNWYM